MKRSQRTEGAVLLLTAALSILFEETDAFVPAAITLMVVGIALIVASREVVKTQPHQTGYWRKPLSGIFGMSRSAFP